MGLKTWRLWILLLILLIFQLTLSDGCKASKTRQRTSQTQTDKSKTNKTTRIIRRRRSYPEDLPKFGTLRKPAFLDLMNIICGMEHLQKETKSLDKTKALSHSWPWIAGLYKAALIPENKRMIAYRDPSPFCTATMVSPKYLITAMHCLMGLNSPKPAILPKKTWFRPEAYLTHKIFIKLGNHYSGEDSDVFKDEHIVDEAIVYTEGLNYPMRDIAILKLEQSANFSDGVQPVCIPPDELRLPFGTECFVVGMNDSEDSDSINNLVELKVSIRKLEDCQQFTSVSRDGHHICAGDENQAITRGMGGGGIYCKLHPDDDRYYLLGVTSLRNSKPGPSIFASVSDVSAWIRKSVDA